MAIIKLKKDKNALHFELNAVQDVKVNDASVFDGEKANIHLKTINNQSIVGTGDITISSGSSDYDDLSNKPSINNVTLTGNKTTSDLGINIPDELADLQDDSTHRLVTDTEKNTWNAKSDFSGSYNDLTDKPTIPSEVTETTVANWGFTKNIGTITSVKMNGQTISSSGEADLGTVITEHQSLSGYQPLIDSSNKLSADLVDDSTTTNKFVTASDKTTWSSKQDELVSGTNIKTINNTSLLGSGDITISAGSTPKKKILTNSSSNYSVSSNVVTVTDADVTTTNHVELYPADATTETWLENNLSSCIITQSTGSFSFNISSSLPATFSMYYIITEVQ